MAGTEEYGDNAPDCSAGIHHALFLPAWRFKVPPLVPSLREKSQSRARVCATHGAGSVA
jgi:hypothetical protein